MFEKYIIDDSLKAPEFLRCCPRPVWHTSYEKSVLNANDRDVHSTMQISFGKESYWQSHVALTEAQADRLILRRKHPQIGAWGLNPHAL